MHRSIFLQDFELADGNQVPLFNDIVRVNGANIAYTSAGDSGTPVVLVHGGASDRTDWAETIPALAASYRVFAPDLIGFGESSRLYITYTMQDFSESLSGFMDAVGIDSAFIWATRWVAGPVSSWRGKRRAGCPRSCWWHPWDSAGYRCSVSC